jgi:hypothetical protein
MSARVAVLPGVKPQPAAREIEHLKGVLGPFGMAVRDQVPSAAVWATDVRASVEALVVGVHAPSINRGEDNRGHTPQSVP